MYTCISILRKAIDIIDILLFFFLLLPRPRLLKPPMLHIPLLLSRHPSNSHRRLPQYFQRNIILMRPIRTSYFIDMLLTFQRLKRAVFIVLPNA